MRVLIALLVQPFHLLELVVEQFAVVHEGGELHELVLHLPAAGEIAVAHAAADLAQFIAALDAQVEVLLGYMP